MTTIHVLTGRRALPAADTPISRYFTTEAAARAALPDLVLSGELVGPVRLEEVELHGDLPAQVLPDGTHVHIRAVAVDQQGNRSAWSTTPAPPVEPEDGLSSCRACGTRNADCRNLPRPCCDQCPRATRALPEQAPAPAGVRAELHELVPLPWRIEGVDRRAMSDAADERVLYVSTGALLESDDERIAELLVRLVNGAEPAALPPAVQAVVEAARDVAGQTDLDATDGVVIALRARLDALEDPSSPTAEDGRRA